MPSANRWLVETDWLAEHLNAPDLVILDASFHLPGSGRDAGAEFNEAHIPGAQFFDIEEISDTENPLPHMLPPAAKFSSRMRHMGIGDGLRIVIYDTTTMAGAARAWWTFRVMGATDVVVLNGGLRKWRAEDRPVESGPPRRRTERHFTVRMNSGLVRDMGDIQRLLTSHAAQIVDARPAGRFAGHDPEPRPVAKQGHMPGALNVPSSSLTAEDGTLKPPAEVKAIFTGQGVDLAKPIVASCGSGVTASLVALALATTGNETAAVYDGSWAEWGAAADTPVEKS